MLSFVSEASIKSILKTDDSFPGRAWHFSLVSRRPGHHFIILSNVSRSGGFWAVLKQCGLILT
jgi:hypothetical protein